MLDKMLALFLAQSFQPGPMPPLRSPGGWPGGRMPVVMPPGGGRRPPFIPGPPMHEVPGRGFFPDPVFPPPGRGMPLDLTPPAGAIGDFPIVVPGPALSPRGRIV